jgi:hypothetical protein
VVWELLVSCVVEGSLRAIVTICAILMRTYIVGPYTTPMLFWSRE